MYRKSARGWEKHLDFMIWDQLSLQIAFLLAYMLRNGLSNPYSHLIYCNVAFILVVIDAGVLLLFESLKNVLKRGYYQEFAMTVKHVILVILVTTFYLFYIKKRGLFQTGIALYDGSVFTCFLSDPYLVERPAEKKNAFQHETFSVDHNYKKHAGYGGL